MCVGGVCVGVAGFVCSLWGLRLLLPWNIGCFFLFTVSAHFPPATLYTLCALYTLYFPLSLCLSHCIRSLLYFSWSLMSCVFYQVIGVMAPCLLLSACIGGGGAVLLVQSTRFAI